MEIIIQIIKVLLLANVIVNFSPINWLVELIPNSLPKYILVLLTSCLKCCSFWLGLVITHDIWISSLIYLIASIITKLKQKYETKELL
jgi:hypothetical protein